MARYRPYTNKLCQRYDNGIPFYVFSVIYLCMFLNYTFVFFPDNVKQNGYLIPLVLYMESLFWFGMSYFAFYMTAFTDAGEPRDDYKHPVPKTIPEEVKAKVQRGEKICDIYTKILIHMGDKAIKRGEDIDDTVTYDHEIGYEEQIMNRKDLVTVNAIMNTFDHKHWNKCNKDVPPRSQHCSVCKRCILKFDHHWGVTGNCIGFKNRKVFVLMHLYTGISGLNVFLQYLVGLLMYKFGSKDDNLTYVAKYVVMMIMLVLVVNITLISLLGQFVAIMKDKWQIDNHWDAKANIFDTGSLIQNIKATFGNPSNKLMWLIPLNYDDIESDGHDFSFYYLEL